MWELAASRLSALCSALAYVPGGAEKALINATTADVDRGAAILTGGGRQNAWGDCRWILRALLM